MQKRHCDSEFFGARDASQVLASGGSDSVSARSHDASEKKGILV